VVSIRNGKGNRAYRRKQAELKRRTDRSARRTPGSRSFESGARGPFVITAVRYCQTGLSLLTLPPYEYVVQFVLEFRTLSGKL
jgi:hypothetical protein